MPGAAFAQSAYDVTVSAGEHDREYTPVSVTLEGDGLSPQTPVCVSRGVNETPGQVELRDDGTSRVWWIASIRGGESATYRIEPGRACADDSGNSFAWHASTENVTTLQYGDRNALAYVHPTYDPADVEHTKKPFHHVYAPDGSQRITKGPGGLYSHHRGIFFGYNEIHVDGEALDTWHAVHGEHQAHRQVVSEHAGPVFGGHTARIEWVDREGEPFIEEMRTLRVYRQPEGEMLIEFTSTLETLRGPIRLDGDRQHAGVQFRAAQYVADNEEDTRYLRPAAWDHLSPDEQHNADDYVDLPWNAIQFRIEDEPYTVAYLSDPGNPDGARFSERLYGRFGEFFPYELDGDEPLTVRYRWWIPARHDITPGAVERRHSDLANPPEVQLQASGGS